MIIILAGIILASFGINHLLFLGNLLKGEHLNSVLFTGLIQLNSIVTMSLASIPILLATYILTQLDIKKKWKSIATTTSLSIFLFAYLSPYFFGTVSYSFFDLFLVVLFNIYIIFKLSKVDDVSKYKTFSYIFLIAIYIYILTFSLQLNLFSHS